MSITVGMFPGQASQYIGMGKDWYDKYDLVRRRFRQASDIIGMDLTKLCFEGPNNELTRTENVQAALVTLSVAMYEVITKEKGVVPSYLAGHSIGEISALTAAGVFSFQDSIMLARARGEAMASCDYERKGGMAAVINMDIDKLASLLTQMNKENASVEIANYNTPSQTIISGDLNMLMEIGEKVKADNVKFILLNVSGPFHSRYMKHAQEKLALALENIELGNIDVPVMCAHQCRLYLPTDDIKAMIVEQIVSPVRWTTTIDELQKLGADRWIEVGPKQVLKKFIQEIIPNANVISYDEENKKAADNSKSEEESPNLVGLCLGAAVSTKNSNWDDNQYKKGVIEPYKKIQEIYKVLQEEKREPTYKEMEDSLAYLNKIFITKGVPVKERSHRFAKILKNSEFEQSFAIYIEGEEVNEHI